MELTPDLNTDFLDNDIVYLYDLEDWLDELANFEGLLDLSEYDKLKSDMEKAILDEPEFFIHDDYFEQYLKNQAHELYDDFVKKLPDTVQNNIDWDGIADDLRHDYSIAEINYTCYHY